MIPDRWRDAATVVVVAHPDDEVLGCGVLLTHLRDVRIIHVTDGAPHRGLDGAKKGFDSPAAYAAARQREAEAALRIAGIETSRLTSLGIADQEVSRFLAETTLKLVPLLRCADLVITHAFEGGHSDHDGVAFATRTALDHLEVTPRAELFEMPFYHGNADGWVRQRFLDRDGAGPELVHASTEAERTTKRLMMAAHATQAETLASFSLDCERFRRAPHYDFKVRPHGGPLLYERHGWNLTWPEWQHRVVAAAAELRRTVVPCP